MSYKLIYFNVTGLGEAIRFLLHHSGIEFEDKRLTSEEWPKVKPEMPMGQVPVLEIDGKPYYQSKAICRLLARQNNLYGDDEFEACRIDATVDTYDDLRVMFSRYYWEEDPDYKAKLKKATLEKVSFYLDKLEEQVKKNGGHFVNGKLTLADIYYAAGSYFLSNVLEYDLHKDHPELKKLVKKVEALPNIKAYLEKRPKTQL